MPGTLARVLRRHTFQIGVITACAAVGLFIDLIPGEELRLICAVGVPLLAGALVGRWWTLLAPLGFVGAILLFGAVANPSQEAALGYWDWDDGEIFLETGYFGLVATLLLLAIILAAAAAIGVGLNRLARRGRGRAEPVRRP